MQSTVRSLEDNVFTFDTNEVGVDLAALYISPSASFRVGGANTETSGKEAS
jgi:hypothetical protein